MKRFYIIDAHSQIHRFFHAPFRPLRSPHGEATKATYLFTTMLKKLIHEKKPDYLCLACDGPKKKLIKRSWNPDYKNGRDQPLPDLKVQIKRIKQICGLIGCQTLTCEGYEADDIIATLVKQFAGKLQIRIISRDKDLMQLVNDRKEVEMYDPMKEEIIDEFVVKQKWKVSPRHLLNVQTLIGDKTDNVIGCRGIGPATAAKLVMLHDDLRGLFDNLEDLPPAISSKLAGYKWKGVRKLVRLLTDAPVPLNLSDYKTNVSFAAATPVFRKLGFQRFSS